MFWVVAKLANNSFYIRARKKQINKNKMDDGAKINNKNTEFMPFIRNNIE